MDATLHAMDAVITEPGSPDLDPVMTALLDLVHDIRMAAAAEDWSLLATLGTTASGMAREALVGLARTEAAQRHDRAGLLAQMSHVGAVLAQAAAADPAMIELIRTQAAAAGLQLPDRALALLDALEADPATADIASLSGGNTDRFRGPVLGTAPVATAAARGLGAQVVASVQRSLTAWEAMPVAGLPDPDLAAEALRRHADTLETRLQEAQAAGHAAAIVFAAAGADPATADAVMPFRQAMAHMAALASEVAIDGAPGQAAAHVLARVERDEGAGGRAEAIGRAALRLARVVREATVTHTAAIALELHAVGTSTADAPATAITAAASMPTSRTLPNATDTQIADALDAAPGTRMEVFGVAVGLETVVEAGGKIVGRLRLADPSSGAAIQANTVFTNPQHIGVTIGAFCAVSGTKVDEVADGGPPRLLVDKVAVSDVAAGSWRGALIDIAHAHLPYWRAGSNLSWTLGPHRVVRTVDAIDEAASDMGAAELIFLPIATTA